MLITFISRLIYFTLGYLIYLLQVILLQFRCYQLARTLLELNARLWLRMLGIHVQMLNSPPATTLPVIFIANHESPIDVLVVQGHLKVRGLTTALDYLQYLCPFLAKSMRNYGHIALKYRCKNSKKKCYYQIAKLLHDKKNILTFPSGSIVTPITKRVSPSSYYHAKSTQAVLIPIFFNYEPNTEIDWLRKKIMQSKTGRFKKTLLLKRLVNKKITLTYKYGEIIDVQTFMNKEEFCTHIKKLYLK
jgi:1-acyl-sn-glycerol-3-phosphate acyltransferase